MPNSKDLIDKWYLDNTNRPHLEAILRDPVMQHALHILHVKASEPVPPNPSTTCDLTQYGAMIGFTRNGAFDILKNLEDLSKNPPRKPADAPPFDPAAQERIVKGARPQTDP